MTTACDICGAAIELKGYFLNKKKSYSIFLCKKCMRTIKDEYGIDISESGYENEREHINESKT